MAQLVLCWAKDKITFAMFLFSFSFNKSKNYPPSASFNKSKNYPLSAGFNKSKNYPLSAGLKKSKDYPTSAGFGNVFIPKSLKTSFQIICITTVKLVLK